MTKKKTTTIRKRTKNSCKIKKSNKDNLMKTKNKKTIEIINENKTILDLE
jgi:hypothetical protein